MPPPCLMFGQMFFSPNTSLLPPPNIFYVVMAGQFGFCFICPKHFIPKHFKLTKFSFLYFRQLEVTFVMIPSANFPCRLFLCEQPCARGIQTINPVPTELYRMDSFRSNQFYQIFFLVFQILTSSIPCKCSLLTMYLIR